MATSTIDPRPSQPQPNAQQQTGRGFPPVIFLKNRDIMTDADWNNKNYLTNTEMYVALTKCIREEYIEGVQKIGGLWRIYIPDLPSRCKLVSEGLNIRGKNVTVHQNNPFTTSPNTVSVKVCDIPLSVDDNEILTVLRHMGAEVIGECK